MIRLLKKIYLSIMERTDRYVATDEGPGIKTVPTKIDMKEHQKKK